jgi:hypothetical protein
MTPKLKAAIGFPIDTRSAEAQWHDSVQAVLHRTGGDWKQATELVTRKNPSLRKRMLAERSAMNHASKGRP